MELREVDMIAMLADRVTRTCISVSVWVWVSAALYLVVRNPWYGVLACGVALGHALCEWWAAADEARERGEEVVELEKQVVALRSTMREMAVMNSELERINNGMTRDRMMMAVMSSELEGAGTGSLRARPRSTTSATTTTTTSSHGGRPDKTGRLVRQSSAQSL